MTWIDDPAAAEAFICSLADAPVAIDTEFMRTQTYFAELALVQVACENRIALFDAKVPGVVEPLKTVLQSQSDKILHSASEDLEVLDRAVGTLPRPLFDTQIAASLVGIQPPPGYQKLIVAELGVELPKSATRSDWLKRPLDALQLDYAADDVRLLPALHARLRSRLIELGRLNWLYEEGDRACAKAQASDPYPHLKVRSAERLTANQQQRLWRLLTWREREAIARNRPRTWILDNGVAMRVALLDSNDVGALRRACNVDGREQPRLVEKLSRVLAAAPTVDELAIPLAAAPDDAGNKAIDACRARVEQAARELGLSAEFLLPRRAIDSWARSGALPAEFAGWREIVLRIGDAA